METNQLNLFAGIALPRSVNRPESLSMDADAFVQWKTKIAAHQQRVKENQPVQGTLFEVAKAHVDLDRIDPFNLRPCPMSFYCLRGKMSIDSESYAKDLMSRFQHCDHQGQNCIN